MKCLLSLAALLTLAACRVEQAPADRLSNQLAGAPASEPRPAPSAASVPPAPAASSTTAPPAKADATETAPVSDVDRQPAAAVAVLQAYCEAIARKDYAGAFAKWGDGGRRSGLTLDQFTAAMRKYDAFDCSFSAPLDQGGAAGSVYLTVPAVITGTLAKGGGFSLRGPFVMRRVNDVDGSTAAQRRWHIESSDLKPRP